MEELKNPAAGGVGEDHRERRRSQRVQMAIPVIVRGKDPDRAFEEETSTVSVNANGCLVRLRTPVEKAQELSLINPKTEGELLCRVMFLGQSKAGKVEVGVEFAQPSPHFWRIAFPPTDWNPAERKLPAVPQPAGKPR